MQGFPLRASLPLLAAALLFVGAGCASTNTPAASPTPVPGGVYRSDDGGQTFSQTSSYENGGTIAGVRPLDFIVDPFDPTHLLLIVDNGGLLESHDSGDHWGPLSTPTRALTSAVIHPRNPHILYIAGSEQGTTRGKIWKSFDDGKTWKEIFSESGGTQSVDRGIYMQRIQPKTVVMTLGIDPQSPEVLYAGSSSGALLASTDGGTTWSARRSFTQGISGLRVSPNVASQLFLRLADGTLARSDDGGRNAKRLDIHDGDVSASTVNSLYFPASPVDRHTLYVATDHGLFRSDDLGDTWHVVTLPVSEQQHVPIANIAQGADRTLYAAAGYNLYTSIDHGSTWRVHQFDIPNAIRFVATDPSAPNRLYVVFSP